MKLKSFRITNYKSIKDSGEVFLGDYITLVGKNESGKTAILKALQKFNVKTNLKYEGFKEFPRKKLSEYTGNETVTTLKFTLNDMEKEKIRKINKNLGYINEITVTKNYSNKINMNLGVKDSPLYLKDIILTYLSNMQKKLDEVIVSYNNASIPLYLTEIKNILTDVFIDVNNDKFLENKKIKINRKLRNIINLLNKSENKKIFREDIKNINDLIKIINNQYTEEIYNYLISILPKFIFFENYEIIDSRIHLPSFVERLNSKALNPAERTTFTLFETVKLDPILIYKLGEKENKSQEQIRMDLDKRSILVNQASLDISGELVDLWGQRETKLEFDIDGEYMRLWVTDNVDDSKIELEERSK